MLIFDSQAFVTIMGILILIGVSHVTWIIYRFRYTAVELTNTTIFFIVVIGLWCISALYVLDLIGLYITPLFSPDFDSVMFMEAHPAGYGWFTSLAGLISLLVGTRLIFSHFLPRVSTEIQERKHQQDRAESHYHVLASTLENMNQGILMVDGEGKILVYNNAFLRTIEVSLEKMRSLGHVNELHEVAKVSLPKDVMEQSRRIGREGKRISYEIRNSQDKVFDVRQNPIAEGGWVRTYTNITERKQTEAFANEVVSNTVDGIITIDTAGTVETYNKSAEKIFGYPASEVVGNNIKMIMPEPVAKAHDGYLKRYLESKAAGSTIFEHHVVGKTREVTGQHKDGTPIELELSISEIQVGGKHAFVGLLHDITSRNQAKARQDFLTQIEHLAGVARIQLAKADGIDRAIEKSLEELGKLLGASQTTMYQFTEKQRALAQVYEWTDTNCESSANIVKEILIRVYVEKEESFFPGFPAKRMIYVKNVREFLSEQPLFLEKFTSQGVHSFVGFPFQDKEQLVAYLILVNPEVLNSIVRPEISAIRTYGESLINSVERRRVEFKLMETRFLQETNVELESRVNERTAELQETTKLAETAKAIADKTLENMSQGILMVDGNGDVLIYNNNFLNYMNITKNQMAAVRTGVELRSLVSGTIGIEGVERSRQLAEDGQEASYGFRTTSGRFLDIRQNKLAEGGWVRTYTDITERKSMEEQLELAKSQAESATRSKAAFLASMSHEIRTPMNGVIGMVDLMLRSSVDLSSDNRKMLHTINESGQSLVTIINEILDFSKIESGKVDLEAIPVSIVDIVEESIQPLATIAIQKDVHLICYIDPSIPGFVLGDPVRIRQIIVNLVSNAIKFTEKGDVVVQAVRVPPLDSDAIHIRFSIVDQGIGISEEDQEKLFEAFSQADSSTTRKFGGTGLGLNICKRLVELMQGQIGVNSKPGEGSEFFFTIPFSPSDEEVERLDSSNALESLSVLLVFNNPTERDPLRRYLEHWHVSVDCAEDSQVAHEICLQRHEHPSAIDVVVFGPQEAREKSISVANSLRDSGLKTKFVFLLQETRILPRPSTENKGVFLDAYPLRRNAFINAVAVAAGRKSPEIVHRKDVENMKSAVDALSIEQAREQGTLILVAEDNVTNRDVIGRQLKLLGYTCEMVEDGQLALEAWRNNDYALLLTDCNMPVMDGYDLARKIRQDEDGADTHATIIAITANALEGASQQCIEAGMDDFISKPMKLEELRQKLDQWMPKAE